MPPASCPLCSQHKNCFNKSRGIKFIICQITVEAEVFLKLVIIKRGASNFLFLPNARDFNYNVYRALYLNLYIQWAPLE